jgi:hydrogenase maturation factor HypF (carbamoyltransferase family)
MLHLSEAGFDVYYQKQVPANDGGISLGQGVIAQRLYEKGMKNVDYEHETIL